MNTPTKQINQELVLIKSLFISLAGRDPEGKYNPAFIRKILARAKNKPTKAFTNARDFLVQIS